MCGIAGIINFDRQSVQEGELRKMNGFMKERGPDGEGYWCNDGIGLAHRRLSIIDLSDKAKQPMLDYKGYAVITYNGELYNFKELKEELCKQQIQFVSDSDTEVIINGCLYWGIQEFLLRADGMFAFVLYNKKENVAFACRDRFGKKPLYYYKNSTQFLFASDIRSISSTINNLTLDYEAIDYYLAELCMPQPKTIWNEIKQVRPAHYLTIDISKNILKESCYWELKFQDESIISAEEAIFETEKLLTQAILKRTVGDVPIGCFLSGGADSGLITAILASHSSHKINTFSVGFTYDEFNELPLAEKLAKRYDTNYTAIMVDADIVHDLQPMINYFGEPFADSSMVPSYYISKQIGKKVKVALSGDGGDEVFGGYHEYASAYNTDEYYKRNNNKLKRAFSRGGNAIMYKAGLTKINYGHLQHYHKLSGAEKLYRGMGFNAHERSELYTSKFPVSLRGYAETYLDEKWRQSNQKSITNTLFESSFETRLLNDYLVKIDRASMMNSVEVRSPFLDYKLIEFAASLPNSIKLRGGITKFVLKKLAENYIDKDFLKRKKQGFSVPMKYWLRKELKEFSTDILTSKSIKERGLFNPEYINTVLKEHQNGKDDHSNKIWTLLCLEIWLQNQKTV